MFRDLCGEAWSAVVGRRLRSALTIIGIALGIAALTATLGLTATAAGQVSDRFDRLQATTVTISGLEAFTDDAGSRRRGRETLDNRLARVRELNGVTDAGLLARTDGDTTSVSRLVAPDISDSVSTPVLSADEAALAVLSTTVVEGRLFDEGHESRKDKVALLGSLAAASLNVTEIDGQTLMYIGQEAFTVIGIVESANVDSEASLSVIVPDWLRTEGGPLHFQAPQVVIRTQPGAAAQIGGEAKVALAPEAPDLLLARVPPDPSRLRGAIQSDVRNVFLLLGGVSLLIGALGISNTTLVSVLERRAEIGLRRAVGASRRAVKWQFLLESALLGLAGGLTGALVGVYVTLGVCLLRDWTATLDAWLILLGPVVGLAVGLLAGLQPAAKAAGVQPLTALNS